MKATELTGIRSSGERFPVEVSSVILPFEPVRSFVILRDISERKQAELALLQSERRLREVLESTHDLVVSLDRNWCFLYVNQRFTEQFHVSETEYIGKVLWDIYPSYIGTILEQQYRKVMEERVPVHFDVGGAYTDRWYEISAYPTQEGISVFAVDRTERHKAQEALKQSEARARQNYLELQAIYANAPVGLCYLDANLRCQAINEMLATANQLPVEAHIGKSIREVLAPEIADMLEPVLRRVMDTGEPLLGWEIKAPYWVDPTTIGYWLISFYPVKGEDGSVQGVSGVIEDITERKRTEETLRANEERFRLMGETLPYGVWLCDPQGKALYTSQSFLDLLEMTMEEMQGFGWSHRLPPEEVQPMLERWLHSVQTGEDWDDEHHILGPDGKYHTVLTRGKPVRDADGNIICWVGINLDIDERKKMEVALKEANAALEDYAEKLRISNKDLEQFAFVASHDLQEPLRKIKLFGNTLRKQVAGNLTKDAEDSLNRMQSAAERMSAMITGLLDLSRVSTSGGKIEPANLTTIAEEVVSDLEPRLQASGGKVIIEALPSAEVDVLQFRQLFQNLIGNALKFHKPDEPPVVRVQGGLIRAGALPRVVITVEDNGIGFDEAFAEKIFQPFMRLNNRGEYEGTGMGLAICQKIVERHRGKMEVHSTSGKGSAFTFHFPVRQSV